MDKGDAGRENGADRMNLLELQARALRVLLELSIGASSVALNPLGQRLERGSEARGGVGVHRFPVLTR
jgi:hypothetical protein